LVDENDLVHHGAFAQELRDIFGINITETDTLYPSARGKILCDSKEYETRDYSALISPNGAQTLATYASDFYAGTPAVTRNAYKKGEAYFIGARTGADYLTHFYAPLFAGLNQPPITSSENVSIQTRRNATAIYYFVMNYAEAPGSFATQTPMTDIITGKAMPAGSHDIVPYGVHILK
jgi:beta-galactosidase